LRSTARAGQIRVGHKRRPPLRPAHAPIQAKLQPRWLYRMVALLAGALLSLQAALPASGQSAATAQRSPTAQDAPAARPRIGLVLGGGGAKGGAHIGVIKVLEELRVPIDCIAGTSMGSLVGAAYATGMSAEHLQRIVTNVNWQGVLGKGPRKDIPYHRKSLDFLFTLGLEVGVKDGGVVFPGGLIPTHQIEDLFRAIVADANGVDDFDKLPIPFRAVATDLQSGQMVAFDHGDLAQAMRASMAVPGAFAPVEAGGHIYADGMLVRNLPIDVARRTCADVVIVVPVSNPGPSAQSLKSLLSVAGQALNIAIEANERAQLATLTDKDVEIRVILKDIGSSDFDKVPEAIPLGEAAARAARTALSRYSLSPEAYAAWRAQLTDVASAGRLKIDEVRLAGFNVTNPAVMRTFLQVKVGDIYNAQKASEDTNRLVARGDFVSVDYRMDTVDGRNVLTYTAVEKPWGPTYLLFDLNLSTAFGSDTAWGIRADLENRWLDSRGGELRTSVQLGQPNLFASTFYQPLDLHQLFFVSVSALALQTLGYVYQGNQAVVQLDTKRYGLELDGGIALSSWGEFSMGVLRGAVDVSTKVGTPEVTDPTGSYALGAYTTRIVYDTFDRRVFATDGSYGQLRGYFSETVLGAASTYRTVALDWATTLTTARVNNWTFAVHGGTDLGSHAPYYDQFAEGGLFNFSGYQFNQLIGREFALGGIQYRRALSLSETTGTAVYLGASLEAGNVYERLDQTPAHGVLVGGALFLGVASKLGPVYLAYGRSQGGESAFYLYLGSSVDLFRP
jgi:NTE family protein